MTRLRTLLPILVAGTAVLVLGSTSASALSGGYKAIASSAGSGVQDGHTGYGPGWIALTFDTDGSPHGPITGYLFHDGEAGAVGNDHFDVSEYYTAPAASVNTPFAGGYAYGNFNGCTWSYLDANGYELADEGTAHSGACTPPNHTTAIFCTDHAADPLCNDGTSEADEPEAGVWKNPGNHRAAINAGGCDVVGNVGASAIYDGGAPALANPIAHIDAGDVQVRYVLKAGSYVMGNLEPTATPQFPYGIEWGFFPRSCLTAI